ncbi:unnamed protein product, partial [Didymodactylos carnosus]
GNGRRITLRGTDLVFASIDNVFIYPTLDVDRLRNALSQTLSFWSILTGRIVVDDDQYIIECSDNPIPFTYTENDQLEYWPDLPVVVDDKTKVQPFIDSVQYKPETESLLRFKVTHLIRSDEYVFGTSFSHMVGDADSNIHFINDLSRVYQHLDPLPPRPVFERDLLNKENLDFSLPLIMDISEKAEKKEAIFDCFTKEKSETDSLNLSFSSDQLTKLHTVGKSNNEVTIHDTLCAYIILTMNKHLFLTTDEHIQRARIVVNYRGICDSLAPYGHYCQADVLTSQLTKDGRLNFVLGTNEVVFNSNFKYDWANQVNFGMTNQCRFHTVTSYNFYFRIFQLNPVKGKDGSWTREDGGAEVAFRIPKGEGKEKFLEGWKKDIEENFANYIKRNISELSHYLLLLEVSKKEAKWVKVVSIHAYFTPPGYTPLPNVPVYISDDNSQSWSFSSNIRQSYFTTLSLYNNMIYAIGSDADSDGNMIIHRSSDNGVILFHGKFAEGVTQIVIANKIMYHPTVTSGVWT